MTSRSEGWSAPRRPASGTGRFAAIDFETANPRADSACALGAVIVEDGRIVDRIYELIRPATPEFTFTAVHGLTWAHVHAAPTFGEIWPRIQARIGAVQFLAAHNAPFDRRVLSGCCATYSLPPVPHPFVCTVTVARRVWDIRPTRLPDVCRRLGIALRHHHADSDAEACARIVIAASEAGWCPWGAGD